MKFRKSSFELQWCTKTEIGLMYQNFWRLGFWANFGRSKINVSSLFEGGGGEGVMDFPSLIIGQGRGDYGSQKLQRWPIPMSMYVPCGERNINICNYTNQRYVYDSCTWWKLRPRTFDIACINSKSIKNIRSRTWFYKYLVYVPKVCWMMQINTLEIETKWPD